MLLFGAAGVAPEHGLGNWPNCCLPHAWHGVIGGHRAQGTRRACSILRQDYCRKAHAKGVANRTALLRHACRQRLIRRGRAVGAGRYAGWGRARRDVFARTAWGGL